MFRVYPGSDLISALPGLGLHHIPRSRLGLPARLTECIAALLQNTLVTAFPLKCVSARSFLCSKPSTGSPFPSETRVAIWSGAGVSNLRDLKPDDFRWSWCNNKRNKAHNKYNVLESSPNYPLPQRPSLWGNCLPQNSSLVPKIWGRLSHGQSPSRSGPVFLPS